MKDLIRIRGARQHNLKNIDVDIPKGKLVVVTGPSGSGKSSLAFHTLFAEGQRRYIESLSLRVRQHMKQLDKPDVDRIEGLSPAIAIEQAPTNSGPKATVATSTEIYDYLSILFAAQGVPHDPKTGERLTKLTAEDIVESILSLDEGLRIMLLAPMDVHLFTDSESLGADLQRQGFVRVRMNGSLEELDSPDLVWPERIENFELVVDRLLVREDSRSRLADSIETALRVSSVEVLVLAQNRGDEDWKEHRFQTAYRNADTGFELPALSPRSFSFHHSLGACEVCKGRGLVDRLSLEKCIPEMERSINDEAFAPLLKACGKKRAVLARELSTFLTAAGVDRKLPLREFDSAFFDRLIFGDAETNFSGLEGMFSNWRKETSLPAKLSDFFTTKTCDLCQGRRLKLEYQSVLLQSGEQWLGIQDFCDLSVEKALLAVQEIVVQKEWTEVLQDVLKDTVARLSFLNSLGLSYLKLNRDVDSLSGGEAQRVRLATQLGGGLSGVLYVLDEPSIGLHAADNGKLLSALEELRNKGNSLVIVEHDEDLITRADWIIDMGVGAGVAGGEVLAEGDLEAIKSSNSSPTGYWLSKRSNLNLPSRASISSDSFLKIISAHAHNLQNINVTIPLNRLVCLSGVSGSGKSTLLHDVLVPSLKAVKYRHGITDFKGCKDLEGYESIQQVIVVDQSPIGRSPRSNPATFTGLFDHLRRLFAQIPESKKRGYKAARFSFNIAGGRCEKCQGAGRQRLDFQFLNDAYAECSACQGRRFNRETLEVSYRGRTIADILEMSFTEALEFLSRVPKMKRILSAAVDLGLGYLSLGQSATTLSGGEAQRLKLATELSKQALDHTLFILDEPTTGLHFQDVAVLLHALRKLCNNGHSVLVIEHNLDVLSSADWLIDLGPSGGEYGGRLLVEGEVQDVIACKDSLTGCFLAKREI